MLTLDPTQAAALVSPNGTGGAFLTSDGDEEMSQGTLTDVDLTGDHGASNKVDVSNESPEADLTVDMESVPNG